MSARERRGESLILSRIQESHAHLEVEIRKLLHEVSRMAEQAVSNAKRVREEGASAVEAVWERLNTLERDTVTLTHVQRVCSDSSKNLPESLQIAEGSNCWRGQTPD